MTSVDTTAAVLVSLEVATWTVVLSTPLTMALGWLLARKSFWGKGLLSAVLMVPMVLPPVVVGLLLLELVGRNTAIGGAFAAVGLPLSFSGAGAVLAAVVVSFPMYVLVARSAFESVEPGLEDVAASLGDRPWRVFTRVTLPLAAPGIAAGAVLSFARALGEFGATIVLAGSQEGETRTIALAVYALLDHPDGESAIWPLVAMSAALSTAALIGFELLNRRARRWRER